MYGIVLATAMMTSTAAPDWGCRGCHGCYGCYGCCSCYGCCGCSGCWGGWGCCGCYGCHGYYAGCYGYCGGWGCCSCYSGWACHGCYGCYGCGGCCCGGYMVSPPVVVPKTTTMPKVGEMIQGESARSPATVMVKAPADVNITVNGTAITRRTAEETFLTPALPSGQTFAYVFSAEATRDGKTVTKTERITVQAGMKSEVDFTAMGQAAAAADVAHLTVKLPDGAHLYVNDVAVSASGTQTFETPKLEKGKKFYYSVRAELQREGRTMTDSKSVSVEAGKSVTVDFTSSASRLTASR
jgi:uncharacterized protein (TIGR03000 family)